MQDLAHRRTAHAEPLARGAEALLIGDGDEHLDPVQLLAHREAELTKA